MLNPIIDGFIWQRNNRLPNPRWLIPKEMNKMKTKKSTSINIRFVNGEADEVVKFREENPDVKYKWIFLLGIEAYKKNLLTK